MKSRFCFLLIGLVLPCCAYALEGGNRLTHIDQFADPYYVGLQTPKLVTPQWVGEQGVEAVIVLAVDDMGEAPRYEEFLRPILTRLKQIDGRAPVSIMTKAVDPQLPQLQKWLDEGLNIETHTYDHPCPCLQGGSLENAKKTFDRSVDVLARIPNGGPVAFRMPCCDSMNSVSPRFFTEMFGKTTPDGRFLNIDSSVFQLLTAKDPALPRSLTFDEDGREKFRKYLPTDRVMANYVEDYPYPYVIDRLCWEFPALMPSDWDAQHLNGKCSPVTLRDLQAAVDAIVIKQGVFSLCFHPHGWISNEQVVELIDYASNRHGQKVKFFNFREVQERIDKHLLDGNPLRAANGQDNGVRLGDLNNDGYMDVVIGNPGARQTRIWSPAAGRWLSCGFPADLVSENSRGLRNETGVRFGALRKNACASALIRNEDIAGAWDFDGRRWIQDPDGLRGLDLQGPIYTSASGRDGGVRLRDLDLDGVCELIVGNQRQQGVFAKAGRGWRLLPFRLPEGAAIVDAEGRDAGLRFVDLDEDGHDDVVFSNAERYSAHAFASMSEGWSRGMLAGKRGDGKELPMIVRGNGTNNGAWFKHGHMWVQNEDTGGSLPDHVDRRNFRVDFLSSLKGWPAP